MAVTLRELDDTSEAAWDAFVTSMPQGTFFHRAAWAKVIRAAFGHRTHYSFTERDGAITGVLPLAQVKTLLFGNTLISVPFRTTRALKSSLAGRTLIWTGAVGNASPFALVATTSS